MALNRALVPLVFALLGLTGLLGLIATVVFKIGSSAEAGYGDAYVVHDVLHYWRSGFAYRDLAVPPLTPAMYGPLTYRWLAAPYQIVGADNPFLGPRIAVVAAFVGCVVTGAVLTKMALGSTRLGALGGILACSFSPFPGWLLQTRGDFPAILCTLLSITSIFANKPWTIGVAGAFAGLAPMFKLNYVTALLVGPLWLLSQRRWKELAVFVATGSTFLVGGHYIIAVLEPRMFENIFALNPILTEYKGVIRIVWSLVSEPPIALAAAGAVSLWLRPAKGRLAVLLIAVIVSAVLGVAASIQIGAHVNYLFETMLLSTPLAVMGLVRLQEQSIRTAGLTLSSVLASLIVVGWVLPGLEAPLRTVQRGMDDRQGRAWNDLADVLRHRSVFTTVPRVALMIRDPVITEPFIHAVWEKVGRRDTRDIADGITEGSYEIVVTARRPGSWRGLDTVTPSIAGAIADAYRPVCSMSGVMIHLPRKVRNSVATESAVLELQRAGCK